MSENAAAARPKRHRTITIDENAGPPRATRATSRSSKGERTVMESFPSIHRPARKSCISRMGKPPRAMVAAATDAEPAVEPAVDPSASCTARRRTVGEFASGKTN